MNERGEIAIRLLSRYAIERRQLGHMRQLGSGGRNFPLRSQRTRSHREVSHSVRHETFTEFQPVAGVWLQHRKCLVWVSFLQQPVSLVDCGIELDGAWLRN